MDAIINFWMAMAMYFAAEGDRQARSLMVSLLHEAIPHPTMVPELELALYGRAIDSHLPWWGDEDRLGAHDMMAHDDDEYYDSEIDPDATDFDTPHYMMRDDNLARQLHDDPIFAVEVKFMHLPRDVSMSWTVYFRPKAHDPAMRGPQRVMIQHDRETNAYYRKRAAGKKRMSLRSHRNGSRPRHIYPEAYFAKGVTDDYGPTIYRSNRRNIRRYDAPMRDTRDGHDLIVRRHILSALDDRIDERAGH